MLPRSEKNPTKNQTQPSTQNPEPALLLVAKFFDNCSLPDRDVPSVKCSPKTNVFLNSRSYAVILHRSSHFAFVEGLGCRKFWHVYRVYHCVFYLYVSV